MSDNDTKASSSGVAGKGWTDKERLVYLFALIESSNIKLDYNATPRPAGRTVIACQRMVDRLKGQLKNELEALEAGDPVQERTTPKKTAKSRKRKEKAEGADVNATPTKRGRKKKVDAEPEPEPEVEVKGETEDEDYVKVEIKDEDMDDEIETEN